MIHTHKRISYIFAMCIFATSMIFSCLASAIIKHYYIRPLRNGDTVYFDNSVAGWDSVRIYIFNSTDQSHPFEWNVRPDMTLVGNNLWQYTITPDSNIEGHGYDFIIFTNSTDDPSWKQQTIDLGFVGSGYAYKVDSWQDGNRSGYWYLYDTSVIFPEYVTTIKTGDTIYFDNSGTNWSEVKVYMFGPNNPDGATPFPWNGTPMDYVSGSIYKFYVDETIGIENYHDTHVVFSNADGTSQTIDLGFIKSGYAYKVESWENNKGIGYWYVYNKTPLIEAINEVSTYLNKLACLEPSEYAAATQAIADGNRALNSEIPLETDAPSDPGAYWNQVDVEIANLQTKLVALKQEYGDNPTVCTFSPVLVKTITNPQTYFRFGDNVDFRIDITNNADFAITTTITERLAGARFSASTTGDYIVTSDQVAETRAIAPGETLSLYATYPVTTDITSRYTNIAEITSATAATAGYYLSDGDHTAGAAFDTQSWEDVPVPTGIDNNKNAFVIIFVSGFALLSSNMILRYKRRQK